MISYSAPALCQGSDEDLILLAGEIILPGSVRPWPGENGLRIWVEGWDQPDDRAAVIARDRFQVLLGVLRSWRADAGQLRHERLAGLGEGSRRDIAGNQWVSVGTAVEYVTGQDEFTRLVDAAAIAIAQSQPLRNALWLNGRADRTAADYYMIHEYAKNEFGDKKRLRDRLGISVNEQERLEQSANKLSPLEGGRHMENGPAPWDLHQCRNFTANLLGQWIRHSKDVR